MDWDLVVRDVANVTLRHVLGGEEYRSDEGPSDKDSYESLLLPHTRNCSKKRWWLSKRSLKPGQPASRHA